ncbi:MAG: hypothetical protein DMF69_03035 [Acidobacteria bacterium]|nr:MAG: hypothetical protein DMF69_03035 [Acidobacteriota bacterium]
MRNFSSKFPYLIFCVVSALLLISCAKTELTTNRDATTPTASPAATTTTTTTASAGDVGVPECDAFIKAYEACVKEKVPAQVRPQFESTLATWRKTWHDQAANPQIRAGLVTACKSAHEQAKTTMKAYNCTF